MTKKKKVLLIGWDAADWKVIHPLMDAGKMPHLQRLVENGSMAQIATLHPALSPMLWTSIATGKRPFKHGIHGFSEPTPDGRAVQPVTNLSRQCKAVWNILNQNEVRSIVIGWWPSHPAEPIDGVTVSDHYHRAARNGKARPLIPGAVHPPELADTLAGLRLHPEELAGPMIQAFVPLAIEIDQDKDRRLAGLAKTLSECVSIHSVATWLLDNQPWDFFAVYYDAIDHFCHGYMKYHPPRQTWIKERDFELYHNVVSTAYLLHDQMLGTLIEKAGPDVTVMLVSDHGFHPDHLRPKGIPEIPAGPAIEHRDFGILVMSGPGIKRDELLHGPCVLDITPTVLALYGLPVGADMDGKVLTGAFEEPPPAEVIPSWDDVPGRDGRHPAHTLLDPVAAKETLEQLVALGYIEKLDDNLEKAVDRTVAELRYNLCEAYQDADRHEEALEIARELYRKNPDEQRFAVRVFVSCQALGRLDEMRSVVEDLDTRRRQLYTEAVARLKELRALGRQRAAERKAAAEAAPKPEEAAPEPEAAQAAPQPGEKRPQRVPLLNEEERIEFARCNDLRRYQPAVVDYLKAQVLSAEHKFFDALECLERVQEAHLARPGLFLQTADLYRRLRRFAEAEQTYAKALSADPDNPHAHLGLSRMALRRRDYAAVVHSALECLQRVYNYPMAHFLLGLGLVGMGDYERAAEAMNAALAINPNFPEAHRRLAILLRRRLNDAAGSAEHWRQYRELRQAARRQRRAPEPAPQYRAQPAAALAVHSAPALPPLGDAVLIVSGLPRSGTSMVMQMLAAGGVPILSDGLRAADEDNPLGYFEYEAVKDLHRNHDWVSQARGKAVKVVAPLVRALPADVLYRVVFVERDLDEILASQAQMLIRRGATVEETAGRRSRIRSEYARLMETTKALLSGIPGVHLLSLDRAAVLRDPRAAAEALNRFAGGGLAIDAMAAQVKPELHRQRLAAAVV